MDDTHFDAWTRRQFGRASGGLLAALLGLAGASAPVSAKHAHHKQHKHQKRRKRHHPSCCGVGGAECGLEVTENCGCCEGLTCARILGESVGHCVMVV
jgi:anaerobic selenocysteine-containing dehydrogenase